MDFPVKTEDTYKASATYASLLAALLNPPTCPFTGNVTDDQIKIVLAEHGIFPDSIRADVEALNLGRCA